MSSAVIEAPFGDVAEQQLLFLYEVLWQDIEPTLVSLVPTPLPSQPSAYVQVSWEDRPRGEVGGVRVKAIHSPDAIAIQLSWNQPTPVRSISDYNVYADACAVLFPADGKQAQVDTMGSEESPVTGWYWRAGSQEIHEITARGIGTVQRSKEHRVRAAARWSDDRWQVVLIGGLDMPQPHLRNAYEVPIAFAVWCGHRAERAGLKSYSPEFHHLRLM